MTKKVTSVDLVMENMEDYNIPAEAIALLDLIDLQPSLSYHRMMGLSKEEKAKKSMELSKSLYAERAVIKIDLTALQEIEVVAFDESMLNRNLAWRILTYNDISGLEIYYDDDTSDYIYLPWSDE